MNDEDLKRLWQAQRFDPPPARSDETQIAALKQKMKTFDRMIFWRDCRESLAAVFVALWFGGTFFTVSEPISRIGCVIIVLAGVFVCWYPIHQKRRVAEAAPDAPMTEALQCELRKVEVQIRLLRSVLWWYLLPFGVGAMVFCLGVQRSLLARTGWTVALAGFSFTFVIVTAMYAVIYWLNQRAVDKHLLPLKREIEATLNFDEAVVQAEPKRKKTMTNTMLAGIVLMILGAVLFVRGKEAAPVPLEYDDPISRTLETIRLKRKVPALAVAVILDGKIVATNAAGLRNLEGVERVTVGDKFHVGSITKSMTATVAARLVEEGKIAWTNTVGEAFADFRDEIHPAYRPVTLEQFLAQRGGAPGNAPGDLWSQAWKSTGTPTARRLEFVKGLLALKPETSPGTKHVYSNQGYAIAGAMLERKTGIAWEELMRRYLFEPLSMKSAGFGAPATNGKVDQPWGHKQTFGLRPVAPGDPHTDNPPAIGPAGTVHCSIEDLAKYAAFHLAGDRGEGKLLPPGAFQKLHTAVANNSEYALGWLVLRRPWARDRALWHNGSNTMFFAVVWIAPNRDFAVVVACNAGGASAEMACDDAAVEMIRKFLPGSI